MCGIVTSRNATYRGVAFGLDSILVGYASSDFYGDTDWMVSTAAQDAEAINLSWNLGAMVADDGDIERFVDALIDDNDVQFVKSCGNEGPADETLTRPGFAYNTIAVANVFFNGTVTRTDDRINGDSSRGPTIAGRKKPDIAAPSQGVVTTSADWATGSDWTSFGGTSGAAPHVTGGYVLVSQLRGDQTTYANKAVLINQADSWTDSGTTTGSDDSQYFGSLWNKTYGWGYLDLGQAYFNGTDVFESYVSTAVAPFPITSPQYRLYKGNMFNSEKATLSWNRHAVYNGTTPPASASSLADMDLRLYRQSDGTQIDSSISVNDNVEQVGINGIQLIGQPSTPVVVKVEMYSTNRYDTYALATEENFSPVTGPAFASSLQSTHVAPGQPVQIRVLVSNTGDVASPNTTVNVTPPAGWTITGGSDPQNIGLIEPGASAYAEWRFDVPCDTNGGSGNFTWAISSASYGETFNGNGAGTVTIDLPGTISADNPIYLSGGTVSGVYSFPTTTAEFYVVGARGSSGDDFNVRIDTSVCQSSSDATSGQGDPVIDFVVTNRNNPAVAAATRYGTVYLWDADASPAVRIEMDLGFDTTTTGSYTKSLPLEEVVEVYEVPLQAGKRYRATLDSTSGNIDSELFVFPPSTTNAARANAAFSANATGAGGDENIVFTAPATGVHGFVLTKNAGSGSITFRVRCTADFNGIGGVTVQDVFDFLAAWFGNDPAANVNGVGGLTVQDVFDYLADWFSGCF